MNAGDPSRPREGGADRRATRAEINLDALHQNVEILRSTLMPGTELMAVVKANAYGHGARMVARTALEAGATRLGVATVGEARQLRASGITAPILILSPIALDEATLAVQLGLDLAIATSELLAAVSAAAGRGAAPTGVHVKIDTGMHRYGADPATAVDLATTVAATPGLRLAGVMTHFATADELDPHFTRQQAAIFEQVLAELAEHGVAPEKRHAANSAGTLQHPGTHYDVVRVGIAMYGLRPSADVALPAGVRPVMTLHSQLGRVHYLAHGDAVGYGCTYGCEAAESIGLVPIGYADGYSRALSNRGWVGVGDERAPIVGRVSMDQTTVRLPEGCNAALGDDVLIMGDTPGSGAPTAEELAALLDTIHYEVVATVAARVPRHYRRHGRIIAVESLSFIEPSSD